MDRPDAHYHQPLPYPIPQSSSQPRMYSESRPVDVTPAQPYYGMQGARSPSDDIPDTVGSDRRESGLGTFNNQR